MPFTFSITFDRKPEKNGRRHEPGRLFPTSIWKSGRVAANRSNRSHPTKSAAIRNLMFQALCESRLAGVNCLGSKARAGADFFPLSFWHPKTCCRKLHRQWLAMLLDQCLELGHYAPNLLEIVVSVTLVSSDCCPFCGILFRHLLSTWP